LKTVPKIDIIQAANPADFQLAKDLILAYVSWLGFDLSFQNFDKELQSITETYSAPNGGVFVAFHNDKAVGVAGIKRFNTTDCEVKRMFVHADSRGLGIGKLLLSACIGLAEKLNYECVKLDTADYMHAAIKLYTEIGFEEIPPYYNNPRDDARYFQLQLPAGNHAAT
jgi:putative acetyltransferase